MTVCENVFRVFFITSCFLTVNTKENPAPTQFIYVNDWNIYNLPCPVSVEALKEILTNVGLYKRQEYCPFEMKYNCVISYTKVVRQIVEDAKEKYKEIYENVNPCVPPKNGDLGLRKKAPLQPSSGPSDLTDKTKSIARNMYNQDAAVLSRYGAVYESGFIKNRKKKPIQRFMRTL